MRSEYRWQSTSVFLEDVILLMQSDFMLGFCLGCYTNDIYLSCSPLEWPNLFQKKVYLAMPLHLIFVKLTFCSQI